MSSSSIPGLVPLNRTLSGSPVTSSMNVSAGSPVSPRLLGSSMGASATSSALASAGSSVPRSLSSSTSSSRSPVKITPPSTEETEQYIRSISSGKTMMASDLSGSNRLSPSSPRSSVRRSMAAVENVARGLMEMVKHSGDINVVVDRVIKAINKHGLSSQVGEALAGESEEIKHKALKRAAFIYAHRWEISKLVVVLMECDHHSLAKMHKKDLVNDIIKHLEAEVHHNELLEQYTRQIRDLL